ncbi:MAG: hypothetical protein H0Z32_08465 [Bacillaceae bacterium]|nr:hypothetical protein [Bacillaceae bacterium]
MSLKRYIIYMLFGFVLLLTGCGTDTFGQPYITGEVERGIPASSIGPSLDEIKEKIKNGDYSNIETMLQNLFPVRDIISEGANQQVKIFEARDVSVQTLSDLITEKILPEHASDFQNNEQIIIFPDGVLTLREDPNSPDTVLLELATLDFVREHYSPNYFDGFLALWILDEVLDVDDWGKKRMSQCKAGNCYEGYPYTKKYRSGNVGSLRGSSSTTRGGGPGAGK